jgi:hypothetical protein
MQQAIYGTYRNGQVFFDGPAPVLDESKVIVVFLNENTIKPKLSDIFKLYGAWEDERTADEIIADTRSSRIARTDIEL